MSVRHTMKIAALAAACISMPLTSARAQLTFSLGGGTTLPVSDLKNAYTNGYNVLASLGIGVPFAPIGLRVDGMFNQMQHQSNVPISSLQMWTLNADVVYNLIHPPLLTPYLIAGGGYYNDSYRLVVSGSSIGAGGNTHANNFGLNGGVGLRAGVSSLSVFLEARLHYVFVSGGHLEFIPITAGITF